MWARRPGRGTPGKLQKAPPLVKAGVTLPPAGRVWHRACFCIASELRTAFDIFQSLNKRKRRKPVMLHESYKKFKFQRLQIFMETQSCLFVYCGLWLLSCCNGRIQELGQRPHGPHSLKYVLPGPLRESVSTIERWRAIGPKLTRWYGNECTSKGLLVEAWRSMA